MLLAQSSVQAMNPSKPWASTIKSSLDRPLSPMAVKRLALARGMSIPEFIGAAPTLGLSGA